MQPFDTFRLLHLNHRKNCERLAATSQLSHVIPCYPWQEPGPGAMRCSMCWFPPGEAPGYARRCDCRGNGGPLDTGDGQPLPHNLKINSFIMFHPVSSMKESQSIHSKPRTQKQWHKADSQHPATPFENFLSSPSAIVQPSTLGPWWCAHYPTIKHDKPRKIFSTGKSSIDAETRGVFMEFPLTGWITIGP